jgi:hypothetical protein
VLVQEAGIMPMLHRTMVATIVEESVIRGVIMESKVGRETILTKRVMLLVMLTSLTEPVHEYIKHP